MKRETDLQRLQAEVAQLRRTNLALAQQQAGDRATITHLRAQVQTLQATNSALRSHAQALEQQLATLHAQLATLQQHVSTLQQQLAATTLPPPPAAPPPWVKPHAAPRPLRRRRKRAPEHNHGRRREPPTRIADHRFSTCPDCASPLQDYRLTQQRQVIEIPPPPPVEIIDHQVWRGWCPHCHRWHAPPFALAGQVVGQSRFGVRFASLIVTLRYQARLPLRVIQALLRDLWAAPISSGGLSGLLHQVQQATQPAFERLLAQARASPVLHMDETGWREQGHNGWVWELATAGPTAVRVYVYDASRAGAVVTKLLNGQFRGVLVSDFYGGYNGYTGVQQRCWVHLLRDLRALKAAQPGEPAVQQWARAVKRLYLAGKEFVTAHEQATAAQRAAQYAELVRQAVRLGQQYAHQGAHPCHALAQRLLRHQDELFQYVRVPGVPADNNLGERGIRPLVVGRKISGGTRSAVGSVTHMNLASLVGTWLARGQAPFAELLHLLSQHPAAQAVYTPE
jgi:hypothetical protein